MSSLTHSFIEMKSQLKSNLEDVTSYFSENQEKNFLVYLMIALSALIVSIGLNFNHSLVIYSGLLINPFIFSIIQLTIGIYKRDNSLTKNAVIKILLGTAMTILIGIVYFQITPFAYDIQAMQSWSEIPISTYLLLLIIGLTIDLFNRAKIPMIIWILKLTLSWTTMLILAPFFALKGNFDLFQEIFLSHKLLFFFFFIGFTALLFSLNITKKDTTDNKWKLIYPIIYSIIIVVGIYFSLNEIMRLTTKYNTDKYIANELNSKSFQINNFTIDKSSKSITVFYTGIKSVKTQDDNLKKKYNLSGYHFEYIEFKN